MARHSPIPALILALAAALTGQTDSAAGSRKATAFDLLRGRDYARALEEFRRDAILYPKSAVVLDGMAWCEFFLGRLDRAEEGFREALRHDPEYRWSRQGLESIAAARTAPLEEVRSLLAAGRHAEARLACQRILDGETAAPRSAFPDARAGEGWALHGLGRHEEAIRAFRQALKERPDFADALRGIGFCEYARGRWVEAHSALAMSLKAEPDHYLARVTLAWCHLRKKDAREALREFQKAAPLVSGPWGALLGMGWCHEALGQPSEALASFEKAVDASALAMDQDLRALAEARPGFRHLFTRTGWSALRQRLDAWAESEFVAALGRRPDDMDARIGLAFARFRLGNYQGALALASEILSSGPEPPAARFPVTLSAGAAAEVAADLRSLRAWAELRLGLFDQALAGFREVASVHPDWPDTRCGIGWVLVSKGDYPAAEAAFLEALRTLPGYPDAESGLAAVTAWRYAEYNAAWQILYGGSAREAGEAFARILDAPGDRFPAARRHLIVASIGWSEALAGDLSAAEKTFARALEMAPGSGLAEKGMGRLRRDRRDFAGAIDHLRRAKKDPEFAKDVDLLILLADCELERHRGDLAQAELDLALAIDAGSARALGLLGRVHLAADRPVDARLALERAIAIAPESIDTDVFRSAIERNPDLHRLHGSFGWAWFNRARYDRAETDFRAATKLDPRDREAVRGLGLTYLRLARLKEAGDTLRAFFEQAPKKENPWGTLSATLSEWGWTLYTARKYAEAQDVFNRLAAAHAGEKILYADPFDGLGWCSHRMQRPDAARAWFLKAIAIAPRHESSLKGLEELAAETR